MAEFDEIKEGYQVINRVILVGRLTKDINLRKTQSGISVGLFTLAVNRQYSKDKEHKEADFVSCIVWRKGAEILSQYTHKGSRIGIDGRIQTRNYEDKNGQRVYVTEERAVSKIVAADLVVLDDFGTESNMREKDEMSEASQFVQRVLYSIFNSQKRIIITSNLSIDKFKSGYNQKLFSRLTRGAKGHVVDFTQLKDKRSEWQNLMK